ncbi:MAG: hypothetical protein WAZ34_14060 [Rhodocyclaceae bacterium]
MFVTATILVGVIAGAITALAGFGIGSLLTPLLSLTVDTKLVVAAVSIPHFFGTARRSGRCLAAGADSHSRRFDASGHPDYRSVDVMS